MGRGPATAFLRARSNGRQTLLLLSRQAPFHLRLRAPSAFFGPGNASRTLRGNGRGTSDRSAHQPRGDPLPAYHAAYTGPLPDYYVSGHLETPVLRPGS